jgi:CRP/FNR family transcriptional regulator
MKINPEHLKLKFPEIENELLNEISKFGEVNEIEQGEVLIRTGQHLTSVIIVLRGTLKVYREGEDGGEYFLYYLKAGQACAMSLACLRNLETSEVLAIAVEDSEVLLIPIVKVNQWVREYPSWQEFVINTYRNRFEEVLTVLDHVAFRGMDERLEFYLKKQQSINKNSNHIEMSHQAIANDLNTSREVVSRLLKKMEQRGLLKLHRNHIELITS